MKRKCLLQGSLRTKAWRHRPSGSAADVYASQREGYDWLRFFNGAIAWHKRENFAACASIVHIDSADVVSTIGTDQTTIGTTWLYTSGGSSSEGLISHRTMYGERPACLAGRPDRLPVEKHLGLDDDVK